MKPGFNHIGFMNTLERGRVAVWIRYAPLAGQKPNPKRAWSFVAVRHEFYTGPEEKTLSVSGDPLGLRMAPCGVQMALDPCTGKVTDPRTAEQIGFVSA